MNCYATAAATAVLCLAAPAPAAPRDEAEVTALVDAFVAAQRDFDQPALARLTTPDYVEVSPVGQVDSRAKMLAFYAPEHKQSAPPLVLTERTIRLHQKTAIATARLAAGRLVLRAVYVARRDGGTWRLLSAQFTPIRSPAGG